MFDKLIDALANMREEEALATAQELIDTDRDPEDVLLACKKAMTVRTQTSPHIDHADCSFSLSTS